MARSTASELPETQLCLVGKKCFFVVTCWVWLLGMAVGYGKPQRFDWGRTSRDQQLLYWSSVGDTELRVSEMVGELKVSLSRWRILAWDFIWFCYKLYIYMGFFNISLDVWNLGIFFGAQVPFVSLMRPTENMRTPISTVTADGAQTVTTDGVWCLKTEFLLERCFEDIWCWTWWHDDMIDIVLCWCWSWCCCV